jgi:hypothetical protein
MEQHSDEMYNRIGSLIRDSIPHIQSAFLRFSDPATEEFSVPLGEGCLVLLSRIKSFSPTFPEYFRLVEASRRLDVKVLVECPLHSITELVGRLYETTKGCPLEVLNNAEIKERIVSPMISTVQTQRARAKMRNAAIISIFYSTGLRLNEIADLKVGDVDLETGRWIPFTRNKNRRRTTRIQESEAIHNG